MNEMNIEEWKEVVAAENESLTKALAPLVAHLHEIGRELYLIRKIMQRKKETKKNG